MDQAPNGHGEDRIEKSRQKQKEHIRQCAASGSRVRKENAQEHAGNNNAVDNNRLRRKILGKITIIRYQTLRSYNIARYIISLKKYKNVSHLTFVHPLDPFDNSF